MDIATMNPIQKRSLYLVNPANGHVYPYHESLEAKGFHVLSRADSRHPANRKPKKKRSPVAAASVIPAAPQFSETALPDFSPVQSRVEPEEPMEMTREVIEAMTREQIVAYAEDTFGVRLNVKRPKPALVDEVIAVQEQAAEQAAAPGPEPDPDEDAIEADHQALPEF